MKVAAVLGIAAVAGVAYLMYKSHRHKQEVVLIEERRKHVPQAPARDVYSGQYVSPYEPKFPYNAAVVQPHRDIHTGRLISNHDPFPSQPKNKAEDYIVGKMVHEFQAEGRIDSNAAASLNARIKSDYMDEIGHIAKLNKYKLKPLHGQALSEYSSLILMVAHLHGLYLSSSARARYEAQQFVKPYANMHSVHQTGAILSDESE